MVTGFVQLCDDIRRETCTKGGTKRLHNPLFLDAGCGIGNIMLIARVAGFEVAGIEYDPELAKVAKRLTCSHVHVGDIAEYSQYKKYDVIYYYVPITNRDKMMRFCNRLGKRMRIGAYVIPLGYSRLFRPENGFEQIIYKGLDSDLRVYRKIGPYRRREEP